MATRRRVVQTQEDEMTMIDQSSSSEPYLHGRRGHCHFCKLLPDWVDQGRKQ